MIHQRGYMSLDEIDRYCHIVSTDKKRAKLSAAERRLRPSESPTIEAVEKNGAIIGYRPKQTDIVKRFDKINPFKEKKPEPDLFTSHP